MSVESLLANLLKKPVGIDYSKLPLKVRGDRPFEAGRKMYFPFFRFDCEESLNCYMGLERANERGIESQETSFYDPENFKFVRPRGEDFLSIADIGKSFLGQVVTISSPLKRLFPSQNSDVLIIQRGFRDSGVYRLCPIGQSKVHDLKFRD